MGRPVRVDNVLATALSVKNDGPVVVESMQILNRTSGAAFLQMFDAAFPGDVTVGTTVPKWAIGFATAGRESMVGMRVLFGKGLQVAMTTTSTGNTAVATGSMVNMEIAD